MFFGILFLLNLSSGNLQTQPLSLENSPNLTSECVYFLIFVFFSKKMSLEILNLSLEKKPNSKKNMRANVFLVTKYACRGCFLYQKKLRTHIFFEFGDFLQTQVQNLQTHFFRKKQNLKNTHTQRLSLENSPNSRVEFGDFSELRFKRNKIRKTCFFKKQNELGEFSNLKC